MKEYAKSFYKSQAWKDCRNAYAARVHHLCENCLARGIYKPGEIVHHIEHITPENISNPEITLNFNNLELVCRDCHAEKHKAKKIFRYEISPDGHVKNFVDPPLSL